MAFGPLKLLEILKNPEGAFGRKLWPGMWRGRVEDVMDPEKRGRIRIRVPAIHGDADLKGPFSPVEHLPWAEPCVMDAGANYGEFHISYRLGDWMWVMFEGGHPDFPIWMGSWYGSTDGSTNPTKSEIPEECRYDRDEAYPHRQMVFKSRRGHKLEVSDELGQLEIKLTDVKGNFVWFDTEEDLMYIWWDGNKKEIIHGDYDLYVDGEKREVIGGSHTRTIHKDENLIITGQAEDANENYPDDKGTNPDPRAPWPSSRTPQWGYRRITVAQDEKKWIGRDQFLTVGRHVYEIVVETISSQFKNVVEWVQQTLTQRMGQDRNIEVGGQEAVNVTGNMIHNTGGTIFHNSASATIPPTPALPPDAAGIPDDRVPNPEYTIQERKPAFEDRIVKYPDDSAVPHGGGSSGKLDASLDNDTGEI